ncbi:unnamed protein product [Urochloa humidicola]
MPLSRAHWDERTLSVYLDLVAKQKELCNWGDKGPTSTGWTNIYHAFNEATNKSYDKRQLQNKWSDLKRAYFNWRDGLKQSGLGRDPYTGEVAYDPVWYAASHGVDSSNPDGDKYKCPPCCDQLFAILGHTPRDRGELVSAGGHGTEDTSTGDSQETPHDLWQEQPPHSGGQSSKRFIGEHSVSSPVKKKSTHTHSLDDCLDDLNEVIADTRRKSGRIIDAEEMLQVNQLLTEDGYSEADPYFPKALNVCRDRIQRRAFLDLKTKEGRKNYVDFTWELMNKSK